ncbi:MAG: dimethyl sulfoxide reductase anchor subunit [Alphaproteobacteria bacterium]|jgi:sulfite dehydrogenase (quinone) subunit SoeC|nr:dimethyl sulfoxide reductase anchor subunit [Alphaproteobacteria bacterium]MBT4019475.1 dimethyl sulfoxide reductase anchor subunit [Alphaproteobacteria bacterium]MBT4967297.1 dimethyl sulfoxide reductase anchor subunit [Alphaproteobacteria bacterium]MBT5160460.1 dimethyl sulfoxide reductase anchor subunit [Alphaproteobacteria bacterium]MBT5917810.1 dimethyl sulfoxide reductase anchor subunit [Alphaproteobacteria bacterium]
MNPAYSVIFFTTASGLGYGLLVFIGVFASLGLLPADRWLGFWGLGLALAAITFGLLSSTFHLGRPERAWRAVSQWRSSWLAREGVLALLTYVPAAVLGIAWVFYEQISGSIALAAIAVAVLSLVTVYCTGKIYASLKTIPAWHQTIVPVNYVILALMTGAVWFLALLNIFSLPSMQVSVMAVVLLVFGLAAKVRFWRQIDHAPVTSTSGTATGLGDLGEVRLLETPNTSANYLNTEMGFKVARKHAAKLRRIAIIFGFVLPALLVILAGLASGVPAVLFSCLAALLMMVGMVAERWLFFAEAKHVVNLYYGETTI